MTKGEAKLLLKAIKVLRNDASDKTASISVVAYPTLKENGQLWIVVNKNQGAKTLTKELEKQYKVKIVCKNKGFFIICATNN